MKSLEMKLKESGKGEKVSLINVKGEFNVVDFYTFDVLATFKDKVKALKYINQNGYELVV